jgi:hypothetical protein
VKCRAISPDTAATRSGCGKNGSNWGANIHPTRDDLPMLALSALRTLSFNREEALATAKHNIDEALGDAA